MIFPKTMLSFRDQKKALPLKKKKFLEMPSAMEEKDD